MIATGALVLHRYVVEEALGEGGMGAVYRARHVELGLPVALKVLSAKCSEALGERFEREARLMARVRHPNVVGVHDYGLLDDFTPCIVMDMVDGESLDARLARRVTLPWREALRLTQGVLAGIGAIHEAGIVHRDLKPSNVLLTASPPDGVKLIDFGIARAVDEARRLTRAGALVGTPEYMAPEQLIGSHGDVRSDLYAAALVFYEMLSGSLPFVTREPGDLLQRVSVACPEPSVPHRMPRPPQAVVDVMMTALEIDPRRRPESARELSDRFDAAEQSAAFDAVTELRRVSASHSGDTPSTDPEAALAAAVKVRALVAAKLPPSRLRAPEERRFLAGLTHGFGRSYSLGAQFWFALAGEGEPVPEAQARADALVTSLGERYRGTVRAAWRLVDPGFALTAAMLSGAAPLHPVLRSLLDELT